MNKYILDTKDNINVRTSRGREATLYRVVATRPFFVYALDENERIFCKKIYPGQKGGYIEKEANLSHMDRAWVDEGAYVIGKALLYGDAWIGPGTVMEDHAQVCGEAKIMGSRIRDHAYIYGRSRITRRSDVGGDLIVKDFAVIKTSAITSDVDCFIYGTAVIDHYRGKLKEHVRDERFCRQHFSG